MPNFFYTLKSHFNNRLFASSAILLVLSGCASVPRYGQMEDSLRQGNYAQAAQTVDDSAKSYGGSSQLLYLFDKSLALHLAGDYAQSNKVLESANHLIDELYTKSLSKEALSYIFNDTSLDYSGEDFERVMVNILGMLNYSFMNQPDDALVEARRADERLRTFAQQYGDADTYKEDALARYISAVLYESKGQLSDAYIDYKKAREAFDQYGPAYATPEPGFLAGDLLRLSKALGFADDFSQWSKQYPGAPFLPEKQLASQKGEVLVLLYEGLAPVKVDRYVTVPVGSLYFKMAFPKFRVRQMPLEKASLSASGVSAPLELVEDVNAIALKDLDERIGRITVKAIARATAKFIANHKIQEEAKKSGNLMTELLAFLGTNIYSLASEQADKRSWRTLPGRIHLARLALDPGTYDLDLSLDTTQGHTAKLFQGVKVEAGKKVFLRASVY